MNFNICLLITAVMDSRFEKIEPTLYRVSTLQSIKSNKYAMFDLDHTIIKPHGGRTFPKDEFDWEWQFPNVPTKLRELDASGWKIIIITSQAQVSKANAAKKTTALMMVINKIQTVIRELNIRADAYISTDKDIWRKPNTTIMERLVLKAVPDEIFYVGDAAGRVSNNDHSDTDRSFAYNLYLLLKFMDPDLKPEQHPKFYTETEYFLNKTETKNWMSFDPQKYLKTHITKPLELNFDPNKQWLIIMTGAPASGKSSVAHSLDLPNKEIVSQDILKSKEKCLKRTRSALVEGKNVVVDNTNPTQEIRAEYISISEVLSRNIQTAIIYMDTPKDLVQHLNQVRIRYTKRKRIPTLAYSVFYKKFSPPKPTEADHVYVVPFTPVFKNKKQFMYFLQRTEPPPFRKRKS